MAFDLTTPKPTNLTLVAPFLDPGTGRAWLQLPTGLTLEEIVAEALPDREVDRPQLRVTLVSGAGMSVIEARLWARVRPKPGVQVIIRVIPGKDALRSVLLAIVSIASFSLGGILGAALVPAAGFGQTLVSTLIGASLSVVGTLLVGALIPQEQPDQITAPRDVFQVSGWQNRAALGAPVPLALGRMRYAPPFAARSYTEIVGDVQYVRALFCFGYGPLKISDLRIGQTPIDEFKNVEIEVREGRSDDAPISLYTQQVIEEVANLELIRPYQEDELGNDLTSEEPVATPRVWRTGEDASRINVILSFPEGLFRIDSEGRFRGDITVEIRLRFRLAGTTDWKDPVIISVTGLRREQFWRQFTYVTDVRGVWEVEIERLTTSDRFSEYTEASFLAAIQTVRTERPIAIDAPMALVAIRVQATRQLNGALDSFNALVERYAPELQPDGTWQEGLPRNPASAALFALQSAANAFPVPDTEIDWDSFADWYRYCADKGLKFDAVRDKGASLRELLKAVGSAGRAAVRHDGVRWGAVIDRPTDLVVDHINPRNSSDFSWSKVFFDPPDAFRVPFLDQTRDYQPAERIVPWPGFEGVPDLTETVDLPGKTDPAEVWVEARRKQYELIYRAESYSMIQDGGARVATRGDQVVVSHDVLDATQVATRVIGIEGELILLDEEVTMVAGEEYALRFMSPVAPADPEAPTLQTVRSSVARLVTEPGTFRSVRLEVQENDPAPALPQVGWVAHFGVASRESLRMKVRGLEAGEDLSVGIDLVPAAPEIDALTDAEVPPPWDGRVGEPTGEQLGAPGIPRVTDVRTLTGTITPLPKQINIQLEPSSDVEIASYVVQYRLQGEATFRTEEALAANNGVTLPPLAFGATVEFRVRAISLNRTPSNYSALFTFQIGRDFSIPDALPPGAVVLEGGLGHASIWVVTTTDNITQEIQLFRVPSGTTLDRAIHAVGNPFPVVPSSTFTFIDGDATRQNLLTDPGFAGSADWTAGTGWTVGSDQAVKVAGAASAVTQDLALPAGETYRLALTLSGVTAGTVTPVLSGTPNAVGAAISQDGQSLQSIEPSGPIQALSIDADAAFEGAIEDVVVFQETAACVPAGAWDYYVEPLGFGVNGPVAGPFTVTII
ncbi:MAG: phage tail protein [Pseudomonadota bacterium]